jgi:hypothetical protein
VTNLAQLARLIRSKNAGPFWLTFDIMFDSSETYLKVKKSGAIKREELARRFNLPQQEFRIYFCDNALAIKISIPRPVTQGDCGDADGHGGQQYAPLMEIEIPDSGFARGHFRRT